MSFVVSDFFFGICGTFCLLCNFCGCKGAVLINYSDVWIHLLCMSMREGQWSLIGTQCGERVAGLYRNKFNPLNSELNPIRHLLALVGGRHIVHVSRIRVKSHPPFASIGRRSPYCPR